MSAQITKDLVTDSLSGTYKTSRKVSRTIIHFDRGSQSLICISRKVDRMWMYFKMLRKETGGTIPLWSLFGGKTK